MFPEITRPYETKAGKTVQKLPMPKNTVKENLWLVLQTRRQPQRKCCSISMAAGLTALATRISINMTGISANDDYAVFNVEYRLAPEHPFPAGLEDCISAYRYLTQQGVRGGDMVFAGDSAGGNLVFALALYLRDHGMELPAGLCTLSPVGALDDSMPSRKERVDRDCIIGADFTEEMQIPPTLVTTMSVPTPLAPIYGDFTGLPPIWILRGHRRRCSTMTPSPCRRPHKTKESR